MTTPQEQRDGPSLLDAYPKWAIPAAKTLSVLIGIGMAVFLLVIGLMSGFSACPENAAPSGFCPDKEDLANRYTALATLFGAFFSVAGGIATGATLRVRWLFAGLALAGVALWVINWATADMSPILT